MARNVRVRCYYVWLTCHGGIKVNSCSVFLKSTPDLNNYDQVPFSNSSGTGYPVRELLHDGGESFDVDTSGIDFRISTVSQFFVSRMTGGKLWNKVHYDR
jgi:hypothetical protein